MRPEPNDLILGIETSCDETAAAVLRGGREVLSSVIASQEALHAHFGGVVPEVASRRHAETITRVTAEALQRASITWPDLCGIAVTHGPGLIGALLVGVSAAKGYALATGLPLVGVNHVEAHLMANFVRLPESALPVAPEVFPSVCLIVSGGHSDIVRVDSPGVYHLLGCTRDDAAGEALDKAARVLGLPYPGGPVIDRLARQGDATAVAFPRPVVADSFDFSFSGVKTALVREAKAWRAAGELTEAQVADLAASFQEAVVDTLLRNATAAALSCGARQLLLAGGVAANSRLREKMAAWGARSGVPVYYPPLSLCTDNAAMVAAAGFDQARRRGFDSLDLDVFSSMPDSANL